MRLHKSRPLDLAEAIHNVIVLQFYHTEENNTISI